MTQPVSVASAEHYFWGENCDGWHLLKREDISIIQERIPAGKAEVLHYHKVSRQFFYILEGVGTMKMNDGTIILNKGEGLEIPSNSPHQFKNDSKADVIFLVVSIPKSHGDRIVVE